MSKCVSGTGQVNAGADYTDEEKEFIAAMVRYQQQHRRRYPSFTEYLAVLKSLGYAKQPQPTENTHAARRSPASH